MIEVPRQFQPTINTIYPPDNVMEFERWFFEKYEGDQTEREYLPIFWTAYYVNNNYGNDKVALQRLQDYIDSRDKTKKYFTIIQYDDAILNDVSGLDLYQFNMSKPYDYPLPLIGQPHPYTFNSEKKYLANFVGGMTHPIREHAKTLIGKKGYYISFDRHDPYEYCKILSESYFTLCYRGYGLNSFRISESLQYGSIPVYISNEFIEPHNLSLGTYCMKVSEENLHKVEDAIEKSVAYTKFIEIMQREIPYVYEMNFTYEGTRDKILKHLLTLK